MAAIRGTKEAPTSPWVANPIRVTRAMARRSPKMRMDLFIMGKESTSPDVGVKKQRLETMTPVILLFRAQTLQFARQGTAALHGWNAYSGTAWQAGRCPYRCRRWGACRSAWRAGNPHPSDASHHRPPRNPVPF